MIKQCTPGFVKELELNAQEGKIEKLVIELKDKGYFADYTIAEESLPLPLSNKLHIASILKDFGAMLAVDKVNSFSIHYIAKDNMCVTSQSYKVTPEDITKETKLEKAKYDIVNAITLITEIGLGATVVSNVYKRGEKQTVNQSTPNQKQNNGKVRYQEITLEDAMNKILEVMK